MYLSRNTIADVSMLLAVSVCPARAALKQRRQSPQVSVHKQSTVASFPVLFRLLFVIIGHYRARQRLTNKGASANFPFSHCSQKALRHYTYLSEGNAFKYRHSVQPETSVDQVPAFLRS